MRRFGLCYALLALWSVQCDSLELPSAFTTTSLDSKTSSEQVNVLPTLENALENDSSLSTTAVDYGSPLVSEAERKDQAEALAKTKTRLMEDAAEKEDDTQAAPAVTDYASPFSSLNPIGDGGKEQQERVASPRLATPNPNEENAPFSSPLTAMGSLRTEPTVATAHDTKPYPALGPRVFTPPPSGLGKPLQHPSGSAAKVTAKAEASYSDIIAQLTDAVNKAP